MTMASRTIRESIWETLSPSWVNWAESPRAEFVLNALGWRRGGKSRTRRQARHRYLT